MIRVIIDTVLFSCMAALVTGGNGRRGPTAIYLQT